ncbi:MAG: hypothetical protein V1895_04125 [Parcubacteria group bacterium]
MSLKKTLIIAGSAVVIGAGSLLGVGLARAAGAESRPTIIDKLVERFNLNKDEVQAVFDELRDERQAEHRAKLEERLQSAVDNGKLTTAQRDAILTKMQENQTFMESLKDKTPEERRAALKQHHQDLKAWADEQNIPQGFRMFVGPGGHKGFGPGPRGPLGPEGEFDQPLGEPALEEPADGGEVGAES